MTAHTPIRSIHDRLPSSAVVEVDESFADDLPLQILCATCNTHFYAQLYHNRLHFAHQTGEPGECKAPRQFRIAASTLLSETLNAVIARNGGLSASVAEILRQLVSYVTIEHAPTVRVCVWHKEPARAA